MVKTLSHDSVVASMLVPIPASDAPLSGGAQRFYANSGPSSRQPATAVPKPPHYATYRMTICGQTVRVRMTFEGILALIRGMDMAWRGNFHACRRREGRAS